MKKLALTFTILTLFFALPVYAEGAVPSGDVRVSVNGLVCDFCARALEKVFGKQEAVENIDINLDTKIITINFKDGGNLDDETIKSLIQDSGYNVEAINRE